MKANRRFFILFSLTISVVMTFVYANVSQSSPGQAPERPTLGTAQLAAFAPTTHPAKAREFYQKVVGLTLVAQNPFILTFDANGTRLRVETVKAFTPQAYTVLGWSVPDISAQVKELKQRGVSFVLVKGYRQDDLGIATLPDGTKLAWFKDADGNVLSLSQFKDRSETVK